MITCRKAHVVDSIMLMLHVDEMISGVQLMLSLCWLELE